MQKWWTAFDANDPSGPRWKHSLVRASTMTLVLAAALSAINLTLGKRGFPWAIVLGVPLVGLILEWTIVVVHTIRNRDQAPANPDVTGRADRNHDPRTRARGE